ncbi:MAG: hypothetical protein QNJ94_22005 [Alphaproteobacteria bacterium]|nr:hypothetical protein [Alphaproteobacteria bacterium]
MKAYLGRMHVYFREMMPIPRHLVLAALTYLGIAAFARYVHQEATPLASLPTLVGIWSVFSLFLMLRLMDEIKDTDIDRALFPERPLPSGRVRLSDIRISLVAAIGLFLLANLFAGWAFWSALIVLGYALLMFRLFFIPDLLRKSLLLALVTHTPVIPLMLLHGFAIFAAEQDRSLADLAWSYVLPYTAMIWSLQVSWEVSRKIRAQDQETRYVTYSKLLGPVGATLLAAGVQAIPVGVCLFLSARLSLSWTYAAICAAGYALVLWANGRFLRRPGAATSNLRPFAEAYSVIILCAQIVAFGGRVPWL